LEAQFSSKIPVAQGSSPQPRRILRPATKTADLRHSAVLINQSCFSRDQ
jgi:hypothetical protein